MTERINRIIVIGLDGLEPTIVEPMLDAGALPNMTELKQQGGYARLGTTWPAQTPTAWSTFATGTNPGGHGIFDFIRRDPKTYLPNLALNRYEQKNPFVRPKAVNLRGGTPIWSVLSDSGVPSTVLRCPCTYPPDETSGRMLSGMGVPDLRGGLGTGTFYTQAEDVKALEDENVVHLSGSSKLFQTYVIGPRHPKTRKDIRFPIDVEVDSASRRITIRSQGEPRELTIECGRWSQWLHACFKAGLLISVYGCVRFYLCRLEPQVEIYASPVNFDPRKPLFPISSPQDYARQLQETIGTFYTAGMAEEHTPLNNGRIDESAFLDQCAQVLREREGMLSYELDRFKSGLLYCLFDTPDRIQHMFWRFREEDHPANRSAPAGDFRQAIEQHYRDCDAIIGRVAQRADERTLIIVLSDHGFSSFRRGMHLNTWLFEQGLLAFKGDSLPDEEQHLLRNVDWDRTKAYALGLGSIYLNRRGREANGILDGDEVDAVSTAIVQGLTSFPDAELDCRAVRRVVRREEVYDGPFLDDAPDLIVGFESGYRVSWATALGGARDGLFEDNTRSWSGDHIIDPDLAPGVLLMNRRFDDSRPNMEDLAPTILNALGVPAPEQMKGDILL
ncbi:MAG: alkaline phosphatase family protein [Planctomycetota bacterium]|jgi:predicted AlkP superfamily phosphohydrolase/phosphomutase